jgi:hypothetical protein
MKRRLFTVAAALSCLLALGVTASWVRSYWVYDQVSCGSTERYGCAWSSYGALFPFPRWPPGIPKGASSAVLTCFGKVLLQQAVYIEEPLRGTASDSYGWSSDDNVIPSFGYFYAVTGDMNGRGQWRVSQVTARHWALVLLFAALPVTWVFAWRRRRFIPPSRPIP